MSINLSDLTSPNNQDVLAEITSAADFLDPIGKLENLSRSPNKGGHALQTVALNQPRALPLDANGKGYCYLPVTTGNAPAVTFPAIGSSDDFVLEMDVYLVDVSSLHLVSGSSQQERIIIYNSGSSFQCNVGNAIYVGSLTLLTEGVSTITVERTSGTVTLKQNGVTKGTINNVTGSATFSHLSFNGQFSTGVPPLNGYIQTCTLSIEGTEQLNIDFTATNVRHGDTKFKCATNQIVTINTAGLDPAKIIKRPVLRFDGVNDGLQGLFANNIDGGYMFAAFSVLGDGGESFGRIFGANKIGGFDYHAGSAVFSYRTALDSTLRSYSGGVIKEHLGLWDDNNGDILHESKITNGSQFSKINNADLGTATFINALQLDEFNIGTNEDNARSNGENAALDLEFVALFPADSVPDEATAKRIRDYINGRGVHPIFSLIDSAAFYFYDATRAPSGAISSGSSAWSGRVVGSDNGDSASLLATQATSNDAPVSDGYTVTFADNTDHLDIPSISQSGYQIVGSSFGTFVYRINGTTAVTELNLLGNLGASSQRKSGDLYGIILLPESATGKDIQEARKLLIDRGASDAATQNHLYAAWHTRNDIVEFQNIAMPQINQLSYTFSYMPNLVSFPAMSFPVGLYFANAWDLNTSMSDFGAIQAPLGNNFSSAWKGCSALTSFPAGAKLGTAASSGVNFSSAWQSSGLTSFPAVDLGNGTTFSSAWNGTSSLLSFSASAKLGTNKTNVSFVNAWINSGLTSFPALDLSTGNNFTQSWYGNSSLTDFSADAKLGTAASNVNFINAWRSSGLTSFSNPLRTGTSFASAWQSCSNLESFNSDFTSATNVQNAFLNCSSLVDFASGTFDVIGTPGNSCFLNTWSGCAALSANSVENILVSINTSGKSAPSTNPQITIDYNTATGSLGAATNAAIDSLSGKGWEVFINGVLVIPNILDLAPAAAYSLRSFDADADPNVVNVRRSTGGTSDFTASEVSDGTLTSWVNTEYETVVNGEFATDSEWTKGVGWSIANGKATSDGTQTGNSYLYQLSNMGASQSQRVTLAVSGYVAGTVKVRLGDSAPASSVTPDLSSNGTYVFTLPSHSAEPYLFLQASSDFQGSIESISVVQLTSDGHVTTWYDQGGTNHATQTVAASQPLLVDSGALVTANSKPLIYFDGNNDSFSIPAGLISNLDTMLVSAVVTNSDGSNDYGVVLGEPNNRIYVPYVSSSQLSIGYADSAVKLQDGAYSNGLQLITLSVDSSTASGFKNGQAFSSVATATASNNAPTVTSNANRIGSFGSLAGAFDFSEVVIFNTDQSANRTGIENNINDTIY